jgi:hypothetical protein
MADWTWYTREIRIREYSLPEKSRWDDAITVTARDDEIIFSYQLSDRTISD